MDDKPAIFDKPDLYYDIMMGSQKLFMSVVRMVKKGNSKYKQEYMFAFSNN